MEQMLILGQSILADRFGKAAQTYNDYADVQDRAALLLADDLRRIAALIPPGPILEIGCGTGLFSQHLAQQLSHRKILLSDIAPDMVRACRERIQSPDVKFAVLDAETCVHWSQKFSLIASAFSAQWFKDVGTTFDGIFESLQPGGYFLFSVPTNESFAEWKKLCSSESLNYTGNHLPNEHKFRAFWSQRTDSFSLRTVRIQTKYANSMEFFRALKSIGATTSTNEIFRAASFAAPGEGTSAEPMTNLRRVMKRWDNAAKGPIIVTYEVMCGIARRPL